MRVPISVAVTPASCPEPYTTSRREAPSGIVTGEYATTSSRGTMPASCAATGLPVRRDRYLRNLCRRANPRSIGIGDILTPDGGAGEHGQHLGGVGAADARSPRAVRLDNHPTPAPDAADVQHRR